MPNRAELRTLLRRRLEDTSGSPLWDDATLNDVLDEAISHYGIRIPAERTTAVVVAGNPTTVTVVPYLESSDILRVRDPGGHAIPRLRAEQGYVTSAGGQAWRWWNGQLILKQPAIDGTWEIDHHTRRHLPANDVDQVEIRVGDEEIVVLLAASSALLRRAVELGKRGSESSGMTLTHIAEKHNREAERLIAARRRRATGGWMQE